MPILAIWFPPVGLFGAALAVLGAVVSIIEFTGWRRILFASLFVCLGLGEGGSILKADSEHKNEIGALNKALDRVQVTLTSTQLQSAADMGYLKGRLDAAINAKPPDIARLGAEIAKENAKMIQQQVKTMSNKELSASAINLARKMREFEHTWRVQEELALDKLWNSQIGVVKTPEERINAMNQQSALFIQFHANEDTAFRNELLGQAVYARDSLLARLGNPVPTVQDHMKMLAFDGILAGPSPISDAADYLEQLARRLSP